MGLIVAFAFSYMAYQAAIRSGRNPVFWIAVVWVMAWGMAIPFSIGGAIIDHATAGNAETEADAAQPFIAYWAAVAGNVLGGGMAVLWAGKATAAKSVASNSPTRP